MLKSGRKTLLPGIEINSLQGGLTKWGTTGTGEGNWGLAVAYESAPTALLNNADGSVKIPVDKRTQFYVYAADPATWQQRMTSFAWSFTWQTARPISNLFVDL